MESPSFSIIIPTYNRPEKLSACVQAVSLLDYPAGRFEVIVVDDGTRADLTSVLAPHREALDLKLIKQDHGGPASARNRGADEARGDFLAFTDDDCRPRKDWLKAFAGRFTGSTDQVLGGRTVNALVDNACSTASQVLVSYICDYFFRKGAPIFPSNNLALSRESFHRVGGFDTRFPFAAGEDREICDRCLAHGSKFVYVEDAVIDHYHSLTLRRFWMQHFNYGRGAFFHHRLRAARGAGRIKVEPFRFYTRLIRSPYSLEPDNRPFRVSLLLVLTQAANAAGFFWEGAMRWRRKT